MARSSATLSPARLASAIILLFPSGILALAAIRYQSSLCGLGAAAQFLGALLFLRYAHVWRPPASGSVILLYIMALGFLWFATRDNNDAFGKFMRGCLLLGAVALFVGHDLTRTGLGPRRRAHQLVNQLLDRKLWPTTLQGIADLPEVLALQSALKEDPSPVFLLLSNVRPEVRIAGFLALDGRTTWRPEEAETVLAHLQNSTESQVRAAGMQALCHVESAVVMQFLASYLVDSSLDVRQKAAEVLLARGANWPVVREGFREALASTVLSGEGPMPGTAGRLPAMAICDLVAWAAEPEPLGDRAVRTLVNHYATLLSSGDYPTLAVELAEQVVDPQSPPGLRLEVALLLRGLDYLTPNILDRMTNADQPSAIRLLAAEVMLSENPSDEDAIDVLRGLGRQSHRETALTIARLVQTYLNIDLGLPEGKIAPHSKLAVEVARKVMQWATGRTIIEHPQRAAVPGLKDTFLPSARADKGSPWGKE